ncbi:MAG: flagellar hook protein FlgE [Candidatus Thiodiazotropha lotti]|uniref:Flagellar hook protein FlgE n=1 Tax=Candidatus Thiodiazotropha lotti TaxID=2792787 RepID=A0A9E4K6Z0_9GAMM|nr:flagellar hook protein FlgE [Candidatus Thiodiazotropha lotti]ODC01583.1 flagellar biosynthesis protein FlgE [Candidatus Thiodiazotropha endoloripes]MCG7922702.1 flagellar hook protein FlgE [Candidatus Thiodiazotropha lotti]MCG7932669.1 flagellar hook protein FlgE [Candidatus Thiodiazotropha lotti]MCG7939960.1 flagellar hook protein FlgE [Candidatus Thiodiazotropha lotti]
MAFRIALSGLDAASTDLEVTGHNIANASTVGFKQSRAEFADIYANSISDVSSSVPGRGVRVTRVAQQFSQGSTEFTSNNLDMAINGEGFFVMEDSAGDRSYSRAGAFSVDRDGNVVDQAGSRLQIFPRIGTTGSLFNTGSTVDLNLPVVSGTPQTTSSIDATLNLSASEQPPAVALDPTAATFTFPPDPLSYNHSTATTIYDSLGTAHTATMFYVKVADNQWNAFSFVDGNNVTVGGNTFADIQFTNSGALAVSTGDVDALGNVVIDDFNPGGGAADISGMTFNYSATSQFGSGFAVNELSQDGFTSGRLSGVDVDDSGIVFARFTNGQSEPLGKIALARFSNTQGLRQIGDTNWAESFASGDVQIGEAGTSSYGLIQSGALENSNVDLAKQLVNLITAQRNFQANAQVITTADAVTQTVINIR